MPQDEVAQPHFVSRLAGQVAVGLRVVVAGNPDQVRRAAQGFQGLPVRLRHPPGSAPVVEGVAQEENSPGCPGLHVGRQAPQGLAGIEGRQELAPAGKG